MRVFAEVAREKALLNVAGDVDLLLEALAFALAFDETGVVKNAGGVRRESVEHLAVELGEGRWTARIQIEHPEKIAPRAVNHGLVRLGAELRAKRNHHIGAVRLRD